MNSKSLKCPDCGKLVDPIIEGADIHCKNRVWECKNCGIFKNQRLIDGEVMREWNK